MDIVFCFNREDITSVKAGENFSIMASNGMMFNFTREAAQEIVNDFGRLLESKEIVAAGHSEQPKKRTWQERLREMEEQQKKEKSAQGK